MFSAKEFGFKVNVEVNPSELVSQRPTANPSLYSEENSTKLKRVHFVVGCANVTQRINLSCVRLTTQFADMLDLVSHACSQNAASDEVDAPRSRSVKSSARRGPHEASPGAGKCWRIMYNVLDLYSSLPRDARAKAKKTLQLRNIPGEAATAAS